MSNKDLLRTALDALETNQYAVADAAPHADVMAYNDAITALREALAAPMPEPVAYVNGDELSNMLDDRTATIAGVRDGWRKTPLYAAPPAAPAPVVREPQDDLIDAVIRDVAELDYSSPEGMPDVMLVTADELRGILQAHGIGGGNG